MKFGSKLETFVVQEWSNKYVRYKELSRLIKRASYFKGDTSKHSNDEEARLACNIFSLDPKEPSVLNPYSSSSTDNEASVMKKNDPLLSNEDCPVICLKDTVEKPSKDHSPPYVLEVTEESETSKSEFASPEDFHDITEVVKLAADQFEECGHLTLSSLPIISRKFSSPRKFHDKLRELEQFSSISKDIVFPKIHASDKMLDISQSEESHHPGFQIFRNRSNRNCRIGSVKFKPDVGISCRIRSKLNFGFRTKFQKVDGAECLPLFDKLLREDIRTVMMQYITEMEYVKILILFLKKDIVNRSGNLDDSYIALIQKACTALWDSCDKLNMYLNLNTLAVYKLLKKKDKLLSTNDVEKLYPVYKNILLSLDIYKELDSEILSLYNLTVKKPIVDFGVLKQHVESALNSKERKPAYDLSYIIGVCTVLLLCCLFLCSYNFKNDFSMELMLSQVPIFRFFFVFGLVWWGFGWCQNYLEMYGVNYQFLFGLSSNYSILDRDFYLFGALQTLLCITVFCAFMLDFKLHVLGSHNRHYLYPTVLIISILFVLIWPHRNFKLKLRKRLIFNVGRVLVTPLRIRDKVTLGDSIIADVLTSLTKPLKDLVYIFTYLGFGLHTDVKTRFSAVEVWIVPIFMSLPYFLRFSQCMKRYIQERRWLHVGNMIKYVSGISCVIVSSISWTNLGIFSKLQSKVLTVCFYVIATIMNFLWDYFIDWGLSQPFNMFKARKGRRMYTKEAYYAACVMNLLCRCTWALTTTPFALIENEELSSEVLVLCVSIVEIIRRIVWVTFRLETEHLLNSYKYRTALWVPKLYNCKTLIVKELSMLNK